MIPVDPIQIECWLFNRAGWVSCEAICSQWNISERRLRRIGAGFLVSRKGGGYIHRFHATPMEIEDYCGRKRAHAHAEIKNIKLLRRLYREHRRPYPATGQLFAL